MINAEKRKEWENRIAQYRASGQSVKNGVQQMMSSLNDYGIGSVSIKPKTMFI